MPISFSSVWADWINFIKNPRIDPLPDSFLELPKKVLPYLFAFDFLLMIPTVGLLNLVGIDDMDHAVVEMMDQPLYLFMAAVIVAPLMEEAIFRLPIGVVWPSNFKIVFWFFTLAFALMHITNFTSQVATYLIPILVLPQLILALLIGYVRVGWGFWYGVLFHAIHNFVIVGIVLLVGPTT
ncbi:MAG: CPBP family intramembrane glutamic endopeptidase [Bacteroidota bacterium]